MRASRPLLAAGAALAVAAAAFAQERAPNRDAPESLLPPGFGDQPAAPAPQPAPAAGPAPVVPPPTPAVTATLPSPTPSPTASPSATPVSQLALYELPDFARRSPSQVGVAGADGLSPAAFGRANGRYVETLMRRLSAPLPSRWLSIALRRLLTGELVTPRGLNGADYAAERAWLLLRMGEATAARAVVQGVDTEYVTPKLRQVWMQAALATADPAALCTLADYPQVRATERGWVLAQAMCTGLNGGNTRALLSDIRRRRVAGGIDLRLAQKVIGAGVQSRQAVTIEWAGVPTLTTWRFGLATATGVPIPDDLYATAGPQVTGWRALAPAIPLAARAGVADAAAGMGVLSNAALVDLYSAAADMDEAPRPLAATADLLRDAYVGADRPTRLGAMKRLWDEPAGAAARYGRLVLTARAAGRLAVVEGVDDPDRLVASMLAAGLDRTALRWRDALPANGDAWAMLLLADPDARGAVSASAIGGYEPVRGDALRKRQLLFAGLAGLGRLRDVEAAAESFDVRIGAENAWTRAIDRAARDDQPGLVLLLAAIGMQTSDWSGVPPAMLYRTIGALRSVGLEGEARMIAAEALART